MYAIEINTKQDNVNVVFYNTNNMVTYYKNKILILNKGLHNFLAIKYYCRDNRFLLYNQKYLN